MKIKYVYHGSSNGGIKEFEPCVPRDLGDNPDNKHKGVYASDDKEWTKIMGIISGPKVGKAGIYSERKNSFGVTYSKKPRFEEFFYLYSFPMDKFENIPK